MTDDSFGKKLCLELPETITTRSGHQFDPRTNLWRFLDGTLGIYLDFDRTNGIVPELLWGLKKVVIWYLEHKSSAGAASVFSALVTLFAKVVKNNGEPLSRLTDTDLLTLRSQERERRGDDDFMRRCKPALLRWYRLGYAGVTDSAAKFLQDVKLKSPPSGTRVTTLDPKQGPFTDIERETLLDALSDSYAEGSTTTQQYVLAWMIAIFGQRPKQFALMKLCDLVCTENDGYISYKLRVPLAKARNERDRSRFQEIELIPELAELFFAYKAEVQEQFRGILENLEQAPFFPSRSIRRADNVEGMQYHRTGVNISDELKATYNKMDVKSERTGTSINITTYRFRYTLGTNCIREGLGIEGTAKRMGQQTTSSIKHYVALAMAYEALDRIEFATAARLGTLAQAFKGILITEESSKDKDTSTHIISPAIEPSMTAPMGSCGKHGFCNFNKPIACYTCKLFRAWLDGPHEEVYAYLEKERSRLISLDCDQSVIRINDRTIIAVANVIVLCNEEMVRRGLKEEICDD